jgi:tRNA(Ile)-lysidine synthase
MTGTLPSHLRAALGRVPDGALCVAYSGGPDSTALLHALAQLPTARARGLRALHVDHGLHTDSTAWAAHCRRFCAELDIGCDVLAVHVARRGGDGLEAAARDARYAALAGALHEGEYLLTAQHRDDQAETVLLKLLRGAGPEGLGGMRERRALGRGTLWRPLLDVPRSVLHDYVAAHELACIDDPSNRDTRLTRNHLRQDILPRLLTHWPQAVQSIVHSAALCRDAEDALQRQWRAALDELRDPATDSLSASGWLALAPALRQPLLDHWLHARGRRAPTTAQRRQIERQCHARPGQVPCIRWADTELHIWKDRLWALPLAPAVDACWQANWDGSALALPDGGRLSLTRDEARLDPPLDVRLRRGGERIRPDGDTCTRELRDLFQQAQIPPWQRVACPLIHVDDELVAVADRWCSARGAALFAAAGARPRWLPGR